MRKKVEEKILSDYEKYYRLAFSYVRNENDAMDVVQESAYKAMKEYRSLKKEEYLSTWLYRIVVNTALDCIRKNKKELIGVVESKEYYEDEYIDFDVMDSLERLDEKEKTIIILRFFEDEKLEDIATILNENLNTVKSRLYRAMKKLRIELEPPRLKENHLAKYEYENPSMIMKENINSDEFKMRKV